MGLMTVTSAEMMFCEAQDVAVMSNLKLCNEVLMKAPGIAEMGTSCVTRPPDDRIIVANVSLSELWRKIISPPLRQLR